MKKIVLLILIILWMIVIFMFSSKTGSESSKQSNGFINLTIGKIIDIFYDDISFEYKEEMIKKVKTPVRKLAHITEYFILSILVCLYINCYKLDIKKVIIYSFIICYIYACSDEIHQLFIEGRSGSFVDTLIDSVGIITCLMIYYFYKRKELNV